MIVALLLAGSDFAELGAELAHALASVARRVAGGWPLVALTFAVALVDLRLSLHEPIAPLLTTAPQLVLLVLSSGWSCGGQRCGAGTPRRCRRRPWWPQPPS
jgi:hypothetical protein